MSLYSKAVNKPVTTALVFVAFAIFGVFSLMNTSIAQFPDFDANTIMVMSSYQGASAQDIETNVTKVLENSLNGVENLKKLSSRSKENISIISLEFEYGTDIEAATNNVRDKLDMVSSLLPDGASQPMIMKFSVDDMPIMILSATAEESISGLNKILDDKVATPLARVSGVGTVSVGGAPTREIQVYCDPYKLQAYGLSVSSIAQIIGAENRNLPSGSIDVGSETYTLRIEKEIDDPSELLDLVVSTSSDKVVYLRDVATVRDGSEEREQESFTNGQRSARIIIQKQNGANTVNVIRDVKKTLKKIEPTLPSDVKITTVVDSSTNIINTINTLKETIIITFLVVMLVVFVFLGRWRATFIIVLSIPIALLASLVYLFATGNTLNIISMSALSIAIGMVVDDAIVVLENITKHIERGANPREASIYATNEVWVSVIATTLVIVAVFVPLTMLGGQAGIMFKELGWIVTIVCCTSTIVAISLTPMLCSKLLKPRKVKIDENGNIVDAEEKKGWYQKYVVGFLDKVDVFYAKILAWTLNHKVVTLILVVAFLVLSFLPVMMGKIGTNFMAPQDNGRLSMTVELQRGTRVEESSRIARIIEEKVKNVSPENILIISSSVGSDDEGGISAMFTSSTNNKISMTVRCTKKYERDITIFEIAEGIRNELNKMPEVINYTVSTSQGGASSNDVDVEIYGYDFDKTNILAEQLKREIANIPGARDINIDREEDRAELQIVFDKEKLARHGLNTATASMYVRNRINGYTAGYLKEDGEEYDIVVRLQEKFRQSTTDIENLILIDAMGKQVKLNELAEVKEYWAPPEIKRKTRQRIVTVNVTPEGVSLGELAASIEKLVDNMDIPSGIIVNVGGSYEDQQETFGDMGALLALIIMLVYIVMASQFENFSKPMIIMTAAIFAIPGVIWALFITNTSLDMIGALGVILLVGIVVKNGIVLVDYINLMRDRGYELNKAITLSGQSRLRPVLMTAFTTILGMVPMALSQSEGSEMWHPMGIVVIGGLLVSTIVTLLVVPVLYAITSRHGERDKEERNRKNFIFMQLNDK